jgi:regulatory protein YycI of two-component signal transduction system YycFG
MEYEKLPGFGVSTTDENSMLRFYQKWENFTTYQNFSWADKYNPNEGPSRYVKRLIVKDNKKDRIIEKKKYLRTVR